MEHALFPHANPYWIQVLEAIERALAETVTEHNELRLSLELADLCEKVFGPGSYDKITGKPSVIGLNGTATKVGLIFLRQTVLDKRLLGLTYLTNQVIVRCEPAVGVPLIDASLDSDGQTEVEFRQLPFAIEFSEQQRKAIAARTHAKVLWLNLPESEQERYGKVLRSDGGPVASRFTEPGRDFAHLASLWLTERTVAIRRLRKQERTRIIELTKYWQEFANEPVANPIYGFAGS